MADDAVEIARGRLEDAYTCHSCEAQVAELDDFLACYGVEGRKEEN